MSPEFGDQNKMNVFFVWQSISVLYISSFVSFCLDSMYKWCHVFFVWLSLIISRSSEKNLDTHTHTHRITAIHLTQYCKSTILQLKKKRLKQRKENVYWVSKYLGNKLKMSLGHLCLSSTSCEHITVFWHLPEKLTTASGHAEEETKEKCSVWVG